MNFKNRDFEEDLKTTDRHMAIGAALLIIIICAFAAFYVYAN